MNTLALKLVITPILIGAASLAGRRWGPAVSGVLVGLPLTSGPVAFFLALSHGPAFAQSATLGVLWGTLSQCVFSLAYGWLALRRGWPAALLAGSGAFLAATLLFQQITLTLWPLFFVIVIGLALALWWMPPAAPEDPSASNTLPRWDIPARMVVATAVVLTLTGLAPALGPKLTGLLTPFPIYAATLAVFAHRLKGPGAAIAVLRGLLIGLFAFACFFLTLALLITQNIALAFALASLVALTCQAGAFWLLRRGSLTPRPPVR